MAKLGARIIKWAYYMWNYLFRNLERCWQVHNLSMVVIMP